jgi:hypothetical protein
MNYCIVLFSVESHVLLSVYLPGTFKRTFDSETKYEDMELSERYEVRSKSSGKLYVAEKEIIE